MPTANESGSDTNTVDDVRIYNYEGAAGQEYCEKDSSESLHEDKSSLITQTEEDEEKTSHASSSSFLSGPKLERLSDASPFGFLGAHWGAERLAYLNPFPFTSPYTNGTTPMSTKEISLASGSPGSSFLSLYHNGQHHLGQPPPAHMGMSPYHLDPKAGYEGRLIPPEYSMSVAAAGLRYPFSPSGQYHYAFPPELTAQMASAWFNPGLIPPHHGLTPPLSHTLIPSPKTDIGNSSHDNQRQLHNLEQKHSLNNGGDKSQMLDGKNGEKKPHIKKPLNAFMLYMKEMRAKVVAECTLKESAAINQILGRRWHALSREEQSKYYEMARKERQRHMLMYPGWSSRQNYSQGKKKKRSRDKNQDGANMKKCRARYGVEQQSQWCKPCRRKKKCSRYSEEGLETAPYSVGSYDGMIEDSDAEQDMPRSSVGGSSLTIMDHLGSSPGSSSAMSPSTSHSSPCLPSSHLQPSPASTSSPMTPGDMATFTMDGIRQCAKTPVGNNPRDISNPLSVNQPAISPSTSQSSPCLPSSHLQPSPASTSSPMTPGDTATFTMDGIRQCTKTPVGNNPRDINNPLSVNQLTSQYAATTQESTDTSRLTMVSVT